MAEHTLKLAFKDSPSGSDDYVDLDKLTATSANPSGSTGIALKYYNEGQIQGDYQEINLEVDIEGSSRQDVIARYRQIVRYLQKTRMYFKKFTGDSDPNTPVPLTGNWPARSDGSWHQGDAAVLTFQADQATYPGYWNVIDYRLEPVDFVTGSLYSLDGVKITLIVQPGFRGARVVADNLIFGDYNPPFTLTGTVQTCGYTMGGAAWTQETSTFGDITPNKALFGIYMLKVTNSTTTTTSTESGDYVTGDVLIPGVWVGGVITSGSAIIKMQGWNGSAWVDLVAIATLTTSMPAWVLKQGAPYTINATTYSKVRLSLTGAATGRVYFDGAFIWRNPVGNVVPVEYVSPGKVVNAPAFNVYNVQGDLPAPVQLWQGLAKLNTINQSIVVAGSLNYDPSFEYPVPPMAFQTTNAGTGALDSTMFFGRTGSFTNGAAALTTYGFYTSAVVYGSDYRSRLYRAFLVYAANDQAGITAVQLFSVGTQKTFTVALPQTYTGNANATANQFRVYDLGDFFLRRPGNAWEETIGTIGSGTSVVLYHSSNANRYTAVTGVILIPAQEFGAIDMVNQTNQLLTVTYNESGAPIAAYASTITGIPVRDLTDNQAATLTGGDFKVYPNSNANQYTCTRFDVLWLKDRDATYPNMYTFDASGLTHTSLRYSPRYLSGVQ
jgi:hypothetical protein